MNLKGSQTERNLFKTFAGESRARNKYTFMLRKLGMMVSSMLQRYLKQLQVMKKLMQEKCLEDI